LQITSIAVLTAIGGFFVVLTAIGGFFAREVEKCPQQV